MEDTYASEWPRGYARRFASGKGGGRGRHRRHDDLERIAALRELRGNMAFGPGPGFGGGGRRRGRGRRRRGDVRMALLILLAEEPRNGYQLMQVIEERSDGRWRPSPGSVYPVLSQLEDEGLVRATEREGSKLFELTEAGHERVAEAKEAAPPWAADEDDAEAEGFHSLRRLITEVAQAAMQVARLGSDQQVQRAVEAMKNARRTLYGILAEDEEEDV